MRLNWICEWAQSGLVIVAAAYGRPAAVEALLTAICRGEPAPDISAAATGEASTSDAAGPADEATPSNGDEPGASTAADRCYTNAMTLRSLHMIRCAVDKAMWLGKDNYEGVNEG